MTTEDEGGRSVPHTEHARMKTHLYRRIDILKARAEAAEATHDRLRCADCGEELHPDEALTGKDGRPLCSQCVFQGLPEELNGGDRLDGREDEYGWADRDDCRGRVIGYHEVRLEQGDCPDDVAAHIDVGMPPQDGTVWANPVYLTAEQAVDAALVLLNAAAIWRAANAPDWPPVGPVDDEDERRRWDLHRHAASIADCTFWVQRHGDGWKATEVETGVTGALGGSVEEAMAHYFAGRLWEGGP